MQYTHFCILQYTHIQVEQSKKGEQTLTKFPKVEQRRGHLSKVAQCLEKVSKGEQSGAEGAVNECRVRGRYIH
jgi:hypothetical protein